MRKTLMWLWAVPATMLLGFLVPPGPPIDYAAKNGAQTTSPGSTSSRNIGRRC